MVKLILLDSQTIQPLQEWVFDHQNLIRIGRVQENDVVLTNFPKISRHHVELRRMGDENIWKVFNLGKNGTFVNGISISDSLLPHNALIQLAKKGPLLKFQIQSASSKSVSIQISENNHSVHCTHQGNPKSNLFCIHCGKPLVEEEQFVRNYQVLKTLTEGGMGTTYLVYDREIETQKGVLPNLFVLKQMNGDLIYIPKAQELFEREARILKSINHPHIPKYYDFFWEDKCKYLIMELVHGQNLSQFIHKNGPIKETEAIKWTLQLCEILTYLHSLSPPLIHRDIKPSNLMLRHIDQAIILLDFGAVKEIGTPWGTRISTEGYSAPEQNLGKPCIQSDIYSVGSTLIFLLTGKNPLHYLQSENKEYNFNLDNVANISSSLAKIITKACRVNLGSRYQTIEELSYDLQNYSVI